MSLLHFYRNYPQLSLCTALIAGLGILGSILFLISNDANQRDQIDRYGRVLAQNAASQAVDATLTQDLVSLQAILQDIGRYPAVVGTTVHNVENQLMVQNGYRADQGVNGKRYHFTAPISVHNNIAGYLQVTLEVPTHSPRNKQFMVIWISAVIISILVIWWSIQLQWWRNVRDQLPSPGSLVRSVVDTIPTIPEAPPEPEPVVVEPPPPPLVAVRVTVKLLNLTRLYQQLNSEGFTNLLHRFDKQLQEIVLLHDGKRRSFQDDTLVIDFISENLQDCTFRALCCARLLHGVCQRSPSPRLQLAISLSPTAAPNEQTKQTLLSHFMAAQKPSISAQKGETLLTEQLVTDPLLERVDIDTTQGRLLGFHAPYQDLLQRQENQLSGSN